MGAGMDIDMRSKGGRRERWAGWRQAVCGLAVVLAGAGLWGVAGSAACRAQENPLGQVATPAPPPKAPTDTRPVIEGADNAAALATS